MQMVLWAARHPPVVARGLCYGRADVQLAESAERAADELRGTFPQAPCSVVWSSPSSRCASVAKVLASHWQADLRLDARLSELDFGDWEGRAWSSIEREEPAAFSTWMNDWKTAAPPGGESIEALAARVGAWLSELREGAFEQSAAGAPVVLAHAGVIRALLVLLEGLPWDDAMKRDVPHLAWQRFRVAQRRT